MHPILTIAVRAARLAGNLIIKNYETLDDTEASQKGSNYRATHVFRASEKLIIAVIRKAYPKHNILTSERGHWIPEDLNTQWVINPLDGVSNFIKRYPYFSISISVRIQDRTEVAVVYDPIRNELFTASRGHGARFNSYRLRSAHAQYLDRITLATDFTFKQKQYSSLYIKVISALLMQRADFRCCGSTGLDLAYVAANRLDGFFKINLKPWEFEAGELLVREAGGLITDFMGGHDYFISGNVVAGNPHVVKAILSTLREEASDILKL